MPAVIGALRAELSASIAQFQADMGRAANAVTAMASRAQRDAQRVQAAGRTMTLALTAPIAAFAAASLHVAGDFEASMNRVQGATGATTAQLAQLTAAARAFGQDRRFTATAREAADVMETLAKNGLSTTDILGGATRATLTLAAATGAQYGPAADVATSAMQQFHVQAADLTGVVDGIVGTLIQSRFGFEDYSQALGQAGGVAGGLGVSLTDFNTVLAATGTLFTSGSDAGTSFKTFLTSLTPTSQQARAMMTRLNLSFFNANGSMRSMGEIAQQLQDRLRPLSDQARTQALQVIFGRDAMRTAIGLMNQGSAGLERISRLIAQGSAQQQMEIRMRGLNGAIRQVQRSAENLMIALGNSGLLEAIAGVVRGVSGLLDRLAALPPQVLAVGAAVAGLVAALGPLLVIWGTIAGALATLEPVLLTIGEGFAAVAGVLVGPWGLAIGAAVAAIVVFRDQIMQVITFIVQTAQQQLGPVFQQIMADFARIWTQLSTGPIGGAVRALVDVIGQLIVVFGEAFGSSVIGLLRIFLGVFSAALNVIADLITAVSRLLSGDFIGAWNAVFHALNTLTGGILQVVVNMVQGIARWVGSLISGAVAQLPEAWRAAAVGAIGWARALYDGVKTWINDHLRPVIAIAMGLINALNVAFTALRGQGAARIGTMTVAPGVNLAAPAAPAAPRPPAQPPRLNPDLSQVGQHHGPSAEERAAQAAARRVEEARQRLAEGIRDLNDQVEHGLGDRQLPATTQAADQLRRRIADITDDAQRAGVSTAAFAGQLGTLRARIAELETAGLAREAATFGRAVDADTRSVREFSNGGLAPLEERLQAVDDSYQQLRSRIQQHIDANRELAARNTDAAASMEELQRQLVALTNAHDAARAAATAQYNAEKHLADLQSAAAVASTAHDIRDLHAARGDNGVLTSDQQHMQQIQDQLDQQRMTAEQHLAELQAQLADAQRVGDQDAIARLSQQVAVQQELFDLVSQTSAVQISAQQRIQDAFTSFSDSIDSSLSDMIVNWRGDLSGIRNAFKQILRDIVIKPGLDWLSSHAGGVINSILSGWGGASTIPPFAGGGSFMVGGGPMLKGVGIDRHLVSLRARTGEQVTVSTPGQQQDAANAMNGTGRAGGPVFAPYIDARGAGPREVDQLKGMLARMQRNFKENTWDAVNEGLMRQKIAPPNF